MTPQQKVEAKTMIVDQEQECNTERPETAKN